MKKAFSTTIIIISLFFCINPTAILAVTEETLSDAIPLRRLQSIRPNSGYAAATQTTLPETVGLVINAFLSLLGVIFIGLMIYAGFMWMTARGDESKVEKAKDTLTRAVVGVVITLGSFAIWNFVLKYFINNS